MGTHEQFRLPDVGEGLTEGEILRWYVAVGDTVVVNQTIVEIETAKAAVELPSRTPAGSSRCSSRPGSTVDVGTPIITIDTAPGTQRTRPTRRASRTARRGPRGGDSEFVPAPKPEREAVLVGYGVHVGVRKPPAAPTGRRFGATGAADPARWPRGRPGRRARSGRRRRPHRPDRPAGRSRRSASSPRTSAWTSPTCRRPVRTAS
jgi:2-oxoisovalerate dehydrogenase E2 component (dihydrolipoyl transacylase)